MQKQSTIGINFADANIFGVPKSRNNADGAKIGRKLSPTKLKNDNTPTKVFKHNNSPPAKQQMDAEELPVATVVPPPISAADNEPLGAHELPKSLAAPPRIYENNTAAPSAMVATNDNGGSSEGSSSGCDLETLFKHPLENTWTLWYLENDRSKSWEDMQNEITSFNSVEDFWSLYHHIKRPSELKVGCDYSMFKKGIRPMWEDDQNKMGGRWIISVSRNNQMEIDHVWLNVLLVLIGESCDHAHDICGAVINVRNKSTKICVWTSDGYNKQSAMEIGNKLRELCQIGRQSMQYQLHKDTMQQPSANVKSVYTL